MSSKRQLSRSQKNKQKSNNRLPQADDQAFLQWQMKYCRQCLFNTVLQCYSIFCIDRWNTTINVSLTQYCSVKVVLQYLCTDRWNTTVNISLTQYQRIKVVLQYFCSDKWNTASNFSLTQHSSIVVFCSSQMKYYSRCLSVFITNDTIGNVTPGR